MVFFNIIKLPHHGRDVHDQIFEMFQNKIFLISTGYNPWGLPDENKIKQLQGTVYRTDIDGDIVLESDGNAWRHQK